jgi:hypothetical protein
MFAKDLQAKPRANRAQPVWRQKMFNLPAAAGRSMTAAPSGSHRTNRLDPPPGDWAVPSWLSGFAFGRTQYDRRPARTLASLGDHLRRDIGVV